jgi:hypothetical protein
MRYDSDDRDESYTDALYEFVDLDWVETECRFCEPVRTVSREAALEIFPPTSRPLYINPLDCPYTRVLTLMFDAYLTSAIHSRIEVLLYVRMQFIQVSRIETAMRRDSKHV